MSGAPGRRARILAELNPIAFRPGRSRLHAADPRVKIAALAVFGVAAGAAGPAGLALLTLMAAAGMADARLDPLRLVRAARLLLAMLVAAALLRAFLVPGDPLWHVGPLSVSRQGAAGGVCLVWRIALVVAGGALLTATTRSWAVRAAVAWALRPLPGIPARRAATMMGLLVRFIPEVLQQAAETRDAQRSRGVEACRNPVRRLALFATGLMRQTLLRADRLTLAMAARGYTDARTDPALAARRRDGLLLAAVAAFCLAAIGM